MRSSEEKMTREIEFLLLFTICRKVRGKMPEDKICPGAAKHFLKNFLRNMHYKFLTANMLF